jgi:hypothetical protein
VSAFSVHTLIHDLGPAILSVFILLKYLTQTKSRKDYSVILLLIFLLYAIPLSALFGANSIGTLGIVAITVFFLTNNTLWGYKV